MVKARIVLTWTVEIHEPTPLPFADPDIVAACIVATKKLLLGALKPDEKFDIVIFEGARYSITMNPSSKRAKKA